MLDFFNIVFGMETERYAEGLEVRPSIFARHLSFHSMLQKKWAGKIQHMSSSGTAVELHS